MWSLEGCWRPMSRGLAALALGGLLGGCFQPLYGDFSPNGSPVLRDQRFHQIINRLETFGLGSGVPGRHP